MSRFNYTGYAEFFSIFLMIGAIRRLFMLFRAPKGALLSHVLQSEYERSYSQTEKCNEISYCSILEAECALFLH
jgi:hypothetical protein